MTRSQHIVTMLSVPIVVWLCTAQAAAQTFEAFTEPKLVVEVAAAATARIVEVNVSRGDQVRRGDLLVRLDSSILEASRCVAAARANSTVQLDARRIEHKLAQEYYEQLASLKDVGAGSSQEVERAKAAADVSALNVKAAMDTLTINKLELQEIDARIKQRRVRSPIDGVVVHVTREPGEFISTNDPHLVTIVQLNQLVATFYLPTSVATRLRAGRRVALRFAANVQTRAAGNVQTRATVAYVAAVTNADSASVRVDITIDNSDGRFRAGVPCWLDLSVAGANPS